MTFLISQSETKYAASLPSFFQTINRLFSSHVFVKCTRDSMDSLCNMRFFGERFRWNRFSWIRGRGRVEKHEQSLC